MGARACVDCKERVKNDSQASVGAIYSNGKLWVERVWVGGGVSGQGVREN